MKIYSLACAAAAVALTAGCDAASDITGLTPPARPSLATTVTQDVPWGFTVANTCNGDQVTFTGTSHFVTHASLDGSGGSHYDVSVVSKGTGVGSVPPLKQYTGQTNSQESNQTKETTTSFIIQDIVRVIGPKATDNYYMHFQWKVTTNANGVAVFRVKEPEVRCTG